VLYVLRMHFQLADTLLPNLINVASQRHRCGAHVLVLSQQFLRARTALRGDGKIRDVAAQSSHLAELLRAQSPEEFTGHFKAEPHVLREIENREWARQIKGLQRELFENCLRQSDFRDRNRSVRRSGQGLGLQYIVHVHGGFRRSFRLLVSLYPQTSWNGEDGLNGPVTCGLLDCCFRVCVPPC
jgi:hypothetical protein